MTLDLKQELQAYPIAPAIRRQMESLLPSVEARLSAEAERLGKDASSLSTPFLFGLLIGMVFARDFKDDKPFEDEIASFVSQTVAELPALGAASFAALSTNSRSSTVSLFHRWAAEDATDDPGTLAQRARDEEDLAARLARQRVSFSGRTDFDFLAGSEGAETQGDNEAQDGNENTDHEAAT